MERVTRSWGFSKCVHSLVLATHGNHLAGFIQDRKNNSRLALGVEVDFEMLILPTVQNASVHLINFHQSKA